MKQRDLSIYLKIIVLGMSICGLLVYIMLVPMYGNTVFDGTQSYERWHYPWLALIWFTAVPYYITMYCLFRIAVNIGKDKSFCIQNATYLKWISYLASIASYLVFAMEVLYMVLGMEHQGTALGLLIIIIFGIAVSIASALLSHMVVKAARLQEENELTI